MLKKESGFAHIVAILGTIVLLIGLAVGLYLIKGQTSLKSKASSNLIQAFEIKDGNNNPVNCEGNKTPPECNISTQDIYIKVKDLESLSK